MAQDSSPMPQPGVTDPEPQDGRPVAGPAEPAIEIDTAPRDSARRSRDPYTDVLLRNATD